MSAAEVRPAPEIEQAWPPIANGRRFWRPPDLWAYPAAVRYAAAAALVAVAAAGAWVLRPWLGPSLTAPFYVAIALAAWLGGVGPGLLATALAMALLDLLFLVPMDGGAWLTWTDLPRLAAFVLAAGLIGSLSASRKRDERALLASERRFRSMFETAAEGIWMVDRGGATGFANDRMAALLGVAPQRLAAGSLFAFLDEATIRPRLERVLAGGGERFDLRVRRPDGGEVVAAVSMNPVRDGEGLVVGAIAMFTDVSDRVRVERALEQANERFTLAADAVEQLVYDWDLASDTIERNAGLLQVVGYRPDEVPATGAWWRAQIHPDDLPPPDRQIMRMAEDRFVAEYRVRHRDGSYRTVRDAGRIVRDEAGAAVRVVGSTIDISERKDAEDALRLLAAAAETLAVDLEPAAAGERVAGLAVPALADHCLLDLVDEAGAVVAGPVVSAPEAAGALTWRPPAAFVLDASPRFEPDLRSAPRGLAPVDVDALRAAGVVSLMVVPLEARGRRLGIMTLLSTDPGRRYGGRDLALAVELARRGALAIESARLLRSLRAAEGRYHGLFAGAKDAILLFDAAGQVVEANPAAVVLTGYGEVELVGRSVTELPAAGEEWARRELARLAASGEWRGELDLCRADGSAVPVDVVVTAVALPGETAYVAVVRDMSERRALERLQEEFVANVAHDLKNPLATIRGQAQLLRRRLARGEPPDPDRLLTGMAAIDAGAERMVAMIDDLVDVARLRGGQPLELRRQPVDLGELARRAIEEVDRSHERHPIRLVAPEEPVVGLWDGGRLERVVANLLSNAVKYSPEGGEVVVRVGREEDAGRVCAVLAVEDHGVGIPAADLPHIFDRYRRGRNVGGIVGSGIGLSGARTIVEQHGGTIAVRSTEGEGSTFTVRLPLDET